MFDSVLLLKLLMRLLLGVYAFCNGLVACFIPCLCILLRVRDLRWVAIMRIQCVLVELQIIHDCPGVKRAICFLCGRSIVV